MFLLKKLITPFLLPLPVCLTATGLGVVLLALTKHRRIGASLAGIGVISLAVLGSSFGSHLLLAPLEAKYPPLDSAFIAKAAQGNGQGTIDFVVVLGGGYACDPRFPAGTTISESSLFRLVEGIRIHRALPSSRLVLSGGNAFRSSSNASIMAEVARTLGIADSSMILEAESRDTEDQARLLEPLLRDRRFVLVTEASHMPRSIALFRKVGLTPIPAPTHFRTLRPSTLILPNLVPAAAYLRKSERALYELMGLLWAKLRGQG